MTELEVPSNSPVRTESDASLSKTDTASDNEELYQSGADIIIIIIIDIISLS